MALISAKVRKKFVIFQAFCSFHCYVYSISCFSLIFCRHYHIRMIVSVRVVLQFCSEHVTAAFGACGADVASYLFPSVGTGCFEIQIGDST